MSLRILVVFFALALAVSPAWGQVQDGVDSSSGAQSALPSGDDYDPPCTFGSTLPLNQSYNGNPRARAFYASGGASLPGNGAILDECANFNVTGHSAPNFLAFNCNSANADGTVPQLPQLIAFTGGTVTRVTVRAGSNSFAGADFTLVAFNAAFGVLDFSTITLAAALAPVSTSAPGTAFVALVGPCVAVVDDLLFG